MHPEAGVGCSALAWACAMPPGTTYTYHLAGAWPAAVEQYISHRDRCSVAKLSTRAHQMRVPYKNSIAHSQGYSMLLPSRTERRDQRVPQRAILQAVSYYCFIQRPAPPGPACADPAPLGPGSAQAAPVPYPPLGRLHRGKSEKAGGWLSSLGLLGSMCQGSPDEGRPQASAA